MRLAAALLVASTVACAIQSPGRASFQAAPRPSPRLLGGDARVEAQAGISFRSGAPAGVRPSQGSRARTAVGVPFRGLADSLARPAGSSLVQRARDAAIRVSLGGRIVRLDLEEYVARVVAGESEPDAPAAAQEALAITVRTFALANMNRHRREGFDLCDTTHCQVPRPATPASRRAAAATAGRVLVHAGRPATVFYSALCGGRSELASAVWPGAIDYVREPLHDEACSGEPGWSVEIRADEIERALRRAGYRGRRLRDLRIVARSASGRVARIRAGGFEPADLSGHDFRIVVGRVAGLTRLRSTAFDVRPTRGGYLFTGRGFGHGVGLCVIGARHRAERGRTAREILAFYFPTLQIASIETALAPSTDGASRAAGSSTAPSADGAAATAVDIVLPVENAGESAELASLVRAARDEISGRAGVAPPRTIRLVVHPTVEAFSRATGEPWWAAGASDGAVIALPPAALLRSQGRLGSAVRQQVAHVLLDAALADRPQWVRDGAALFFSSDDPAPAPAGRVECPADEELLRPLSAGAHRMALARAEACFRRAIAQGKRWSEVR